MIRPNQKAHLIEVTPETASAWLLRSRNFRKPNDNRIGRFKDIFAAGGWVCDGNAFKFDVAGYFIDGQHRAAAIVAARVTVWAWVITGFDTDITIDETCARTTTQKLENMGERNARELSAVVHLLWKHIRGFSFWSGQAIRPSRAELLTTLADNPSIRESLTVGHKTGNILVRSQAAFVHYVIAKTNKEKADAFFDAVISGANLGIDDPIRRLRDRMLKDRASKKEKLPAVEKLALLIKAWNLWNSGRTVGVLIVRLTGDKAEDFPTISSPL